MFLGFLLQLDHSIWTWLEQSCLRYSPTMFLSLKALRYYVFTALCLWPRTDASLGIVVADEGHDDACQLVSFANVAKSAVRVTWCVKRKLVRRSGSLKHLVTILALPARVDYADYANLTNLAHVEPTLLFAAFYPYPLPVMLTWPS